MKIDVMLSSLPLFMGGAVVTLNLRLTALLIGLLRAMLSTGDGEVEVAKAMGTSLASIVTLQDITGAARAVNSKYYLPFAAFLTAAAFYLAL